MNDFTKEELKRIWTNLFEERQWVEDCVNPDPLIEKIQYMIDNHCEHDIFSLDMGNYYEVHSCKKCGADYDNQ